MAPKATTEKTATKKTTAKKTTTAKAETEKKAAIVKKAATTKTKKVTEAQIRKRAEEIYNNRLVNGIPGDSVSDWVQAEKELA